MYLSNIRIKGFRGIRSLDLRLGATTVLIGDNDWGKASFFEVLDRCLGCHTHDAPIFTEEDRHVIAGKAVDSISIELTFRENSAGELDKDNYGALSEYATPSGDRRCVMIRIEATPQEGDKETTSSVTSGPKHDSDALQALELFRRFCPVLIVRPDQGMGNLSPATDSNAGDNRSRIERQIEQAYDKIVSVRQPITAKEVDDAVADVGELLQEHALQVMPEPPQAGELLESLGGIPQKLALGGGPALEVGKHGSATQAISLLVLAGALLHARGPRALDPMAMPLALIVEPEAHLHPTLLAGVWGLIESMNTQRVISTYSGTLLARVELHTLRRLERTPNGIVVHRVLRDSLDSEDRRRLGYHIRALRGGALFARTWILIEGETEFWLLPEWASLLGHDLVAHGIRVIEFAQCGLEPIAKLANTLGIPWLLLTDGDGAGDQYVSLAKKLMHENLFSKRIVQLKEKDIEHHLFTHGFAEVYRRASGRGSKKRRNEQPSSVIHAAIDARSKPDLALSVLEFAEDMPRGQLSTVLTGLIDRAIDSANRES